MKISPKRLHKIKRSNNQSHKIRKKHKKNVDRVKALNKKSLSALTFSPVVPENKLFSGESPVTFWLSDDDRKIPLRLSASMRFGEFDIETVDFDNMIDDKSKEIIYNKYK